MLSLAIFIGATATNKSTFGNGPGVIFLDEVGCTGNESRLIDCPSTGYGATDCFTNENAGVRCGKHSVLHAHVWIDL